MRSETGLSGRLPSGRARWAGDISGAFADLGTFLPLVIGLLVLGTYDPSGVLVGFGVFAVVTGLVYRRPVPVQPMKAVAALAIAGGIDAATVSASGLLIGLALLVLGATGLILRMQRLIPRTVLLGIQLGLGLQLIAAGATMLESGVWLCLLALVLIAALRATPVGAASGLMVLAGAIAWSLGAGAGPVLEAAIGWHWPGLAEIGPAAFGEALGTAVLPQLALTVTNAVLLTAALSAQYFPEAKERVTARNLCLSSGALNVLLAPFGAMPMCHGAGGMAAQVSQGARTGLAPIIFGGACLALGVLAGPEALAWLSLVPLPVVAAFLMLAGLQLASPRSLATVRPDCLVIIALIALTALLVNVAAALVVGLAAELCARGLRRRGRRVEAER